MAVIGRDTLNLGSFKEHVRVINRRERGTQASDRLRKCHLFPKMYTWKQAQHRGTTGLFQGA
jgi:hypothetical protein